MREAVLAVDPGVMTGWALWDSELGLRSWGQDDFESFLQRAELLAEQAGDLNIVCERYTITAETLRRSRQTASLEIIGALRWLAHKEHLGFTLQLPATAKKFATDYRLTAMGWKQPSSQDHANDALRHLLLFLVQTKRVGVPRGEG